MTRGDHAHPPSPLPPPLASALGPALAALYRYEITRRNRRYDRNINVTRFDQPVISIGNLSVGGTGKTPMVARVISWLLEQGHHPAIAMRGYKSTAATRSDEADEYNRNLPKASDGSSIPIIAQPDRIAGLRSLLNSPAGKSIDRIVLDDGFQHRKIARDFDIVLIDATRSPFEDRLLPQGWLREPIESLRRAHAIVITHAQGIDQSTLSDLCDRIAALAPAATLAITRHAWRGLRTLTAEEPVSWLAGKPTLAICAIGNPQPFLNTAAQATGGGLVAQIILADHDPYPPRTIDRLISTAISSRAQAILTTEKDWSKLRHIDPSRWPCPLARPILDIAFLEGEDRLIAALDAAMP